MTEVFRSIDQIFTATDKGSCDKCGVCCTQLSINSRMPDGTMFVKPAGETCLYLGTDNLCSVWNDRNKQPSVCRTIQPLNSLCRFDLRGIPNGNILHIKYLQELESLTSPENRE